MKWGLIFGLFPGAYVALVTIVAGESPSEEYGLGLPLLVVLYLLGGAAGGLVYGMMKRHVRGKMGNACMGVGALLPFSLSVAVADGLRVGQVDWVLILSFAIAALFVGGASGYFFLPER